AWNQKNTLAAAASARPQAGTRRARPTQRRRDSPCTMRCSTVGHTPDRSSASASSRAVRSIESCSVVSARTATSHDGQAPAWRATASKVGAGSSASTKASRSCATSPQVIVTSDEPPQASLQLAARVVETAHHRALRTVEHLTDLLVREPFQLAKKYDRSVIGGQTFNCVLDTACDLGIAGSLERLVGRRTVELEGQRRAGVLGVERDVRELRVPALVVDAEVVRDPVHPGVERGITLEAIEILIGFGEGLLHDVQRVLATPQYSERQCRNLAL